MGNHSIQYSRTEQIALKSSFFEGVYSPTEKLPTIVVDYFLSLGRFAAVRFIEWVQNNPGGVIALPTGKTPEFFIKWVNYFLSDWNSAPIRQDLEKAGIEASRKPDLKSLHFVQIDEFYPIDSAQTNSFHYYVNNFYLKGFSLDPQKALLIDAVRIGLKPHEKLFDIWPDHVVDLTLRYRRPKTLLEERQKQVLESIDQWCMEYEDRINRLGGIGFFLGGIGPDGHIGFNISGSDHHSTTRLCPINYETQAAAAVDLGGIETARKSLVITIGLGTITRNRNCTAIIIAAGEAKAGVVAQAVQADKNVAIPATALHGLPNARFYVTRGAASQLVERQYHLLKSAKTLDDAQTDKILADTAMKQRRPIVQLSREDCAADPFAQLLLSKRQEGLSELVHSVRDRLVQKVERGMNVLENKCFLHTEPHHDDIMLGYFAHIVRHFRKANNTHHFATLTSGFTSVTNHFMQDQLTRLTTFLSTPSFQELIRQGYFNKGNLIDRNRDVWQYLDGVAARDAHVKADGCARRLLRNLIEICDDSFLLNIEKRIQELQNYFTSAYPGKRDPAFIQQLKGSCREWEIECLWGYYGWECSNVNHLRLSFYTGDVFTKEPTLENDVPPIVELMNRTQPDVITVALDPEGSGPDTHYKVLQAIAEALKIYEKQTSKKDIRVWGYRNVWYRFDPSEANIFVPVSLCMFNVMHQSFENAFISQRNASFPSYEHDGPFSELAQRIQVEQYHKIKTCLGREWFYHHPSPLIRATRGFVFLKEMKPDEFYSCCRQLQRSIEHFD